MKRFLLFTGLLIFISCSKSNDGINGKVINSTIKSQIEIRAGETLIVNLGNFGDEEGAGIIRNPRNAKISIIFRLINSNLI